MLVLSAVRHAVDYEKKAVAPGICRGVRLYNFRTDRGGAARRFRRDPFSFTLSEFAAVAQLLLVVCKICSLVITISLT